MKNITQIILIVLVLLAEVNSLLAGNSNHPFTISLEALQINGLPGLQSFACAQYNGKWLIACGRLDGLHKAMGMGMMGAPFPTSGSNNKLLVIDPVTKQFWSASLTTLATDIQEQLSSTNPEFFQDSDYLYIAGGYGYKSAVGKHVTFDKLIAISLPDAINSIVTGAPVSNSIRQISDTLFQVTGGEMGKIGSNYFLVGGHNFDGTYHHMNGMGMFTQTYSNQIRTFRITDNGGIIVIDSVKVVTDEINLHRRDYNMVQQIMPDGSEGLTVFSGVFQITLDLPFLNSVNITANGYAVNNAFAQYYNHYQCANAALYSSSENEMHTLFFGGIAQYYDSAGILIADNQVPFVRTIARVTRDSNGNMSEYKLATEMPALLGAGSEFFLNPELPHYSNDVVKLDSINEDTVLLGYVLGGIQSPQPNVFNSSMMGSNGTSAVSNIFKVYLTKESSFSGGDELNSHSTNHLGFHVYPNPTTGEVTISLTPEKSGSVQLVILNSSGEIIRNESLYSEKSNSAVTLTMDKPAAGIYTVVVSTGNGSASQRIVVH